jgi:hypothetical protein
MTDKDFSNVKTYTGEELAKPAPTAVSTGMAAEQSQAIAKIQAALTIAQARPRDEDMAIKRIVKSCGRKVLAEKAEYAYKRGTTLIVGPSIQVAKVIATHWQNMKFGFREIGSGPDYTEVEAYAWDLETNTEASRVFKVYNRRYSSSQKQVLTKDRDLAENIASVAQRRVRACIQQVIPEDVFDAAVEACRETLKKADSRPLNEKIKSMITAFGKIGVTQAMLEGFLGHAVTGAVEAQVLDLRRVYRSIKDGIGTIDEFFDVPSPVEDAKARIEEAEKKKKPRKPRSDKGKKRSAQPPEDPKGDPPQPPAESQPEPTPLVTDTQAEFNPVEELYALADQLWGNEAGANLNAACSQHGVELAELTPGQASMMLDVLGQIEVNE